MQDDDNDASLPRITDHTQHCAECGAELEPDFAAAEGLHLLLTCPTHGAQGIVDPRDFLR